MPPSTSIVISRQNDSLQRTHHGYHLIMIPNSMAHNFGMYQRQARRKIRQELVNRGPHHYLTGARDQREEFEPIDYFSSRKHQYNEMEVESSSAAATPPKEEQPDAEVDIAVVQPSFDDNDGSGKKSSPTNRGEGHRRNLSEHFHDATKLSGEDLTDAGQKHRRAYSGDVSHPAQAHRRIDSVGKSTSIQRSKPHRRIDSSGLDALTAAADFSREELEATSAGRHSWNKHPNLRRSPIETPPTYDHPHHGPPPPSHPTPPHLGPHHRHYSSLTSSGGLPGRPVYYNHPPYHQPPYPHTYHYPHHPMSNSYVRHHGPHHPQPPPPGSYPVQYARSHGQDPYIKHHTPLQQPVLDTEGPPNRASPTVASIDHNQPAAKPTDAMGPPAPHHWPRGGSTQGVQTYITGIGVGDTARTIAPAPRSSPGASAHHRKLSSFSNLGPLLFGGPAQADSIGSGGAHHRATSSNISFLGALDVNMKDNADAAFLRNLQETTGTPAAAYDSVNLHIKDDSSTGKPSSNVPLASKIHPGGTSKRVRRKCTIEGCENRVVQGGLCISHGAKRKLCKYPGCKKHVKKAGLCSTHGPARKRCDVDGCVKVAVQGGRCIAHGAKKKLCSIDQCTKQAILSGMCKKHHDQSQGGENPVCTIIEPKKSRPSKGLKKPGHTRGLSIFQEMSADIVGDLLSPDANKNAGKASSEADGSHDSAEETSPNHRHRSTASQLLVDMV